MDPIERFPNAIKAEFERLVAEGFDAYRRGRVDDALVAWEDALSLRPGDRTVVGYVDYVRANYDHVTGGAGAAAGERLVPFGIGGDGDYEISITREPLPPERLAEPATDDGWGFEAEDTGVSVSTIELEADEPPAPLEAPALVRARAVTASLDLDDDEATTDYASLSFGGAVVAAGGGRPVTVDPADDADEATLGRAGARPGPLELDLDLDLGPSLAPAAPRGLDAFDFHDLEPSGEQTRERPASTPPTLARATQRTWPPASAPLPGIGELSLDLDPVDPAADALELGIEAHVPGPEPLPQAPTVRFDEAPVAVEELRLPPPRSSMLVDADDPTPMRAAAPPGALADRLLADIDRGAPGGQTVDEVARRRITALLERARAASADGEFDVATTAIDLALAEAPDSAVSQKLIHRHRDVILDCYYRYYGSLDRRPIVAGDMTKVGPGGLEPRAAFLLSRIDGMLTFDELLDVAGMGRLEACRHLAALIRRGLVRSE